MSKKIESPGPNDLILASASQSRQRLLKNAGVDFVSVPSQADEDALKQVHKNLTPAELSLKLSEAKAEQVSQTYPDNWVIGSDQVVALDGRRFSKAADADDLREKLLALRGETHHLYSGVALARAGEVVWTFVDTVELTMREFSEDFLEAYIKDSGTGLYRCAGGYMVEHRGLQLFEKIDGDYFTILGMPLLPLLNELRYKGVLRV